MFRKSINLLTMRNLVAFQTSLQIQPASYRFFAHHRSKNARKPAIPRPPKIEDKVAELEVHYPPDDLDPKQKMLARICEELKTGQNVQILLPSTNSYLYDQIVSNIDQLINKHGVRPEFVLDATIKNPKLFQCLVSSPEATLDVLVTLVQFGNFGFEDAMRILALFPNEILEHGARNCAANIEAISACGVSAPRQIHSMLKRCPPLIFARDPEEMRKVAHELGAFFSRKQSSQLIVKCPEVLLKPIEEIEEKYEYVFYQMGAEPDELSECKSWIEDLSLEQIQNRHTFLVKCGRYQTPDPKRPQIRQENPKMLRIVDSKDDDFACNVARVSSEEWVVYQALRAKEEENENKERKYERIKPSKRKAFERRFKTAERPEEHVFDVQYS